MIYGVVVSRVRYGTVRYGTVRYLTDNDRVCLERDQDLLYCFMEHQLGIVSNNTPREKTAEIIAYLIKTDDRKEKG